MTFDYHEIISESVKRNVSPRMVAKEKANYRKTFEGYLRCENCRFKMKALWNDVTRLQCLEIGVFDEPEADIEKNCRCDLFTRKLG